MIGYRDGEWIYTTTESIIGWLDDQDNWICGEKGEPLGYLDP